MVTELLLKQRHPEYSDKELQTAWAAHVEDGVSAIRNHKNLYGLIGAL
ncbi:DndE family protein [Pseudoalteromonas sp. Angola-4]|nr:DndE family protein [Pseudoalteromonas sp. Angola-4]MDC9511305.1 DndE family protein [Pseudoalteromonas sp. Angola-4]